MGTNQIHWMVAKRRRRRRAARGRRAVVSKVVYGSVWCIVAVVCLALCLGAMSMAGTMDAGIVGVDVMIGWGLSVGVQWLLLEPALLMILMGASLFLKWCTSFDLDELMMEKEEGKSFTPVEPIEAKNGIEAASKPSGVFMDMRSDRAICDGCVLMSGRDGL